MQIISLLLSSFNFSLPSLSLDLLKDRISALIREENAQDGIEYLLVVGGISVVLIGGAIAVAGIGGDIATAVCGAIADLGDPFSDISC